MTTTTTLKIPDSVVETMAGGFAGFCQVIVGHPFDTIKVRLQTSSNGHSNALASTLSLIRHEGPLAFYKGVTSPIMGIAACNSILFAANGFFRKHIMIENQPHIEQLDRIALSGSLSGGVMAVINCPIELFKVRLQIQDHNQITKKYTSVFDCATKTLRSDGVSGIYRGFLPTFLRDFPSFAAYFAVYDGFKAKLKETSIGETAWTPIISGGSAGIAAWLVCYPQDVVKSVMQSSSKKISLSEATLQLYRTAGLKGFFKGFSPTMARAFPANAATFLGYELVTKLFNVSDF